MAASSPHHADDLFIQFSGENAVLCRESTTARLVEEGRRGVSALAQWLLSQRAETVMATVRDRWHLALLLQAARTCGVTLILPPNLRRTTLRTIAENWSQAPILDDEHCAELLITSTVAKNFEGLALADRSFAYRPWIIVYTSGSTGTYTGHHKTVQSIDAELAALRATFLDFSTHDVLSSVPGFHIYGLLFSTLLPWSCGRAFFRVTPTYPDDIARIGRTNPNIVLVSTPAHLHHLPRCASQGLGGISRIFSSGAPLAPELWATLQNRLKMPVTSIYGSTETGGIAYKSTPKNRWTLFDGIELRTEGDDYRLHSPYIEKEGRILEDAIIGQGDRHFELLGRKDDIVKCAGLRVSLQHMAQELQELPGVDDAVTIRVPTTGPRQFEIWALVATTKYDSSQLREKLRDSFEPVALPRRIRCVPAIEREATGKMPRHKILSAFDTGHAKSSGLQVLDRRVTSQNGASTAEFRLHTPADWHFFDDHFPKVHVLPAVAQLHLLVLDLAKQVWPQMGYPVQLSRVKFKLPIVPDDVLDLRLDYDPARGALSFQILRENDLCANGRVRLSNPTAPIPESADAQHA